MSSVRIFSLHEAFSVCLADIYVGTLMKVYADHSAIEMQLILDFCIVDSTFKHCF